jgi:hypothetical protein
MGRQQMGRRAQMVSGAAHDCSTFRVSPVAGGGERGRLRIAARWAAAAIAISLLWSSTALAGEPRVLLLRGWFGVFSTGLDGLADELKAKGIQAEVAGHLYWSKAVDDFVQQRAAGNTGPIVLIGHSQGANNVIDMAYALEQHKIQVDLLVTLAPFLQRPVPANVLRAVDYYQSPGWGAPLTTDGGFHGTIANNDVAGDWTITHISIDKSPKIHGDIVREIEGAIQASASAQDAGRNSSTAAAARPRSSGRDARP